MPRPHGSILRQNTYVSAGVIKVGDVCVLNNAGKVAVAAAGTTTGIIGVANSYAKAADVDVIVCDHPEQEYLIKRSGAAPVAQTDYMLNYDLVAGTSTTYESAHTLDSASGATTATLAFKAVRSSKQAVTSIGDSECVVRVNQSAFRAGTLGV
jgi:ABC-type tungstate transport system permease subunit